ncbi:MAG: glycosyltransferase family 39 protein [Candidatus Hydrogenedentota bacterium]
MSDSVEDARAPWEAWVAALLPVVLLLPFINKAYHIDDTVYLLIAEQILAHPLDFYGFEMNWTGRSEWVYAFNQNPPGLSYYLAVVALIFGWSEPVMHVAMLLPASLAALGIYRLAECLCGRPLLATGIAVLTPGFLVSSSNVMCEPMMLACYVWAMVYWVRGLDSGKKGHLFASVFLIGAGVMVKFIAVTVLPLLVAYTIVRERKTSLKLFWFFVPCLMLAAYDLVAYIQYEKSFIREIILYSTYHTSHASHGTLMQSVIVPLSFAGGCYLSALLFLPFTKGRRLGLFVLGVFFVLATAMFVMGGFDDAYAMYNDDGIRLGFAFQVVLYATGGIYLFILAFSDLWRERNAESLTLLLLVGGIFIFSGFVNWVVNARSLLPMVPAVGILVVRRIDLSGGVRWGRVGLGVPLCVAGVLSLLVTLGDYRFAGTAREFAEQVDAEVSGVSGTVWYDGHLGFQYYMHEAGYAPMDFSEITGELGDPGYFEAVNVALEPIEAGDVILIWDQRRLTNKIPEERALESKVYQMSGAPWISIFDDDTGAGFYGLPYASLPYCFGVTGPQTYEMYKMK